MQVTSLEGPLQDRIKLDDAELEIIKAALKTKLFKSGGNLEERLPKFQAMITALAEKFNVPEPKVVLVEELVAADDGHGALGYVYDVGSNTIQVGRLSLVSILNGFATAMQVKQEGGEVNEQFIRAFGLSVFKQAAPNLFESAKANGRLYYASEAYTDGGRIQPVEYNDDGDVEGTDTTNEAGDADRGNGPGED